MCIFANMPQHFTYTLWYNTYFMTSSVEFQFDKGKLHTRRYLLLAFGTCVRMCMRVNGCWSVCVWVSMLCFGFRIHSLMLLTFRLTFRKDTVGLVFETKRNCQRLRSTIRLFSISVNIYYREDRMCLRVFSKLAAVKKIRGGIFDSIENNRRFFFFQQKSIYLL